MAVMLTPNPPLRSRRGFTLLEILVVIGIIAVLLVALIPALSISKSSARKGAVSNLLGAIEQARAEAIKSGQSTYVVFPISIGDAKLAERYSYRSYSIFKDDPSGRKQITSWKTLPTGVSLRSDISGSPWTTDVEFAFTPEGPTQTEKFPYLKFNPNGEIEVPPSPPSNVSMTVFEGYVTGATEVATGKKDGAGNPLAAESITVARLTGRAERIPLPQ